MMGMNVSYSGPESSNPMSCGVWMICNVASVVCHGRFCSCNLSVLNGITLICFYSGLCPSLCCNLEQPLYRSWWLELQCMLYLDCDLDLSLLFQSSWQCLEPDLVWQFLCILWYSAGVPEGGILLGQSMTLCLYSSHSWHLILGQCCVMCPGSRHWKHWSSSFDIMLPIDDGRMVVVSCCAALKFPTSVMASFSVCGIFL